MGVAFDCCLIVLKSIKEIKMARGGKRNGAGRKPNSLTVKTREIAERATAVGPTPLEVILEAMRQARDEGDREAAAGFARDAAPYCHPRLAAVQHTVGGHLRVKQDDPLVNIILNDPDAARFACGLLERIEPGAGNAGGAGEPGDAAPLACGPPPEPAQPGPD